MNKLLVWSLLGLAGVATAQAAHTNFAEISDDIYAVAKDQDTEQANDKKLQQSEQAQTFASEAEEKARQQLEQDAAQWETERADANNFRQRIIDSGCPPEGGEVPIDLANRCNPLADQHKAMIAKLNNEADSIKARAQQVNDLRDSISATVASNAIERKRINGALADLAARMEGLQGQAISQAARLRPAAAQRACGTECCHRVIYDGADPKLCGVGLMCHSFQAAGLFGKVPICAVVSSTTPLQGGPEQAIAKYKASGKASATTNRMLDRGTVPSPDLEAQKPKWDEAAYQRKVADWQAQVDQNRQANEDYQRKLAEIATQHADDVAKAKQMQADWQRRVAACQGGDYSQCH